MICGVISAAVAVEQNKFELKAAKSIFYTQFIFFSHFSLIHDPLCVVSNTPENWFRTSFLCSSLFLSQTSNSGNPTLCLPGPRRSRACGPPQWKWLGLEGTSQPLWRRSAGNYSEWHGWRSVWLVMDVTVLDRPCTVADEPVLILMYDPGVTEQGHREGILFYGKVISAAWVHFLSSHM